MNQAAKKQKKKPGLLIKGNFPLSESPAAVQMTVHINNILNTWNKKRSIKLIKAMLYSENLTELSFGEQKVVTRMNQIIQYYGMEYCQQWFSEIYGWEFNRQKEAI